MLVCLQDNSCCGIETYYTTLLNGNLGYFMDAYAFYETSTLSATAPTAGFYNDFGYYTGFSPQIFYSSDEETWDALDNGFVFYRFMNTYQDSVRYKSGELMTVWTASSLAKGQNMPVANF